MTDELPKEDEGQESETAGAEVESRPEEGVGEHEEHQAGTDEVDDTGGAECPPAVAAAPNVEGGSAEDPAEKEKTPPPDGAASSAENSSAAVAEAGVVIGSKRLGDSNVEEIPPGMVESATSLADLEKSPAPDPGPAAAKGDGDGGGTNQRGEKRPAAGEATPPTPPLTAKPPAPNHSRRQGVGGGGGHEPENLGAAGDVPEKKKAGKQRRTQRQKQQQGVAADPAGAGGAQPRRVQQRRAAPRGQQRADRPENRAPGQQPQQQPQQRVVLGVPSWLGSTFSTYAGSINRRTAMTLLGVTAVVGASVGSVIAMGGAGGAESGVRGTSSGAAAGASGARGSGGMAARTSATGESSPVPTSEILALGGAEPPAGTVLPAAFDSYAEFDSPAAEGEVPFFLHVPRSGGLTMMEIMGKCLDLVVAGGEVGTRGGHENDKELLVIETPSGSYVNCDPTTPMGIERCQSLDLVGSGLADVVSSPLPYEASSLFTSEKRGRMFALLRPIVDRSVSHFRWIQTSGADPYITTGTSLEQYAWLPTDRPEFNWLTKALAGKPGSTTDILTVDDLNIAKEALRRKAIVGLLPRKGDSVLRFERRFGWDQALASSPERKRCEEETLHWEWKGKGDQSSSSFAKSQSAWAPGTELHSALERRNAFDVELYRYAERLFEEQMAAFQDNADPYNQAQRQHPNLASSPAVPLSNGVVATANTKSLVAAEQVGVSQSSSARSSEVCRKDLMLSAALAYLAAMEI